MPGSKQPGPVAPELHQPLRTAIDELVLAAEQAKPDLDDETVAVDPPRWQVLYTTLVDTARALRDELLGRAARALPCPACAPPQNSLGSVGVMLEGSSGRFICVRCGFWLDAELLAIRQSPDYQQHARHAAMHADAHDHDAGADRPPDETVVQTVRSLRRTE